MNNDWDILQNFNKCLVDNGNNTFSLRTTGGSGFPDSVIVVDIGGQGDFTTIAAAIASSSSGDKILVMPGTYSENSLTLPDGVDLNGIARGQTIIGDGSNNTILNVTGNSFISHVTFSTSNSIGNNSAICIKGLNSSVDNIYLFDCDFKGGFDCVSFSSSSGKNIFVEGCYFRDFWYDGGNLSGGANYNFRNNVCISSPVHTNETSWLALGSGSHYIFNNFIILNRSANESSLSVFRLFDPATILYSSNNKAYLDAGTQEAYGFSLAFGTTSSTTVNSVNDFFYLTGSVTGAMNSVSGFGDGVFNVTGGNITTQSNFGFAPSYSAQEQSPSSLMNPVSDNPNRPVFKLSTRATSGTNSLQKFVQNRTTTTSSTQATLLTIPISSGTTTGVRVDVTGRRTGGSAGTAEDAIYSNAFCCVKNVSGTATLVASPDVHEFTDQTSWGATYTVSGGNLLVRVTGATNNNITWTGTAVINETST